MLNSLLQRIDDPEYYFKLRKAKVVPGKKIATGINQYVYL